jgi:tetratricopeptide (TPR) repeat protein
LADGSREITIRSVLDTGRFNATLLSGRRIAVQIHLAFDLTSPVTWTLGLDEPAQVAERGDAMVRFALGGATSLAVQASPVAMRVLESDASSPYPSCAFDLGAGKTDITIDLEVGAWANIADTVVICRPDQMREAAMALAAIPDRRFIPLMVLEPPPMSLAELAGIFKEFHAQVTKTLGEFGAFGPAEFEQKSEAEVRQHFSDWAGRRAHQEQMQPHRSWAKRNTMFRRALLDFGVTKAVCLFEPAAEDLVLSGIEYAMMEMPPGKIDVSSVDGLLSGIERIALKSCGDPHDPPVSREARLTAVFEECREVLGTAPGLEPVEAQDDDPAGAILGLYEARRQGRPLRIVPGGRHTGQMPTRVVRAPAADHVVAVEVHDHAQSLIASLYAAEIGATFAVTPAPDLTRTESIVRELQAAVVERAQRSVIESVIAPAEGDADDAKGIPAWASGLGDALRRFVNSDRRPELLKALEEEVSRRIAPELVAAVGTGALTVFGGGLPYSFFKSGAVDWTTKRIGHVIADADLLVLSEFHNSGAIDPIVSFNVIVDPGFFANSETDVVAEALKGRPAKSLVLRKDSQIASIFLPLLKSVPLDFIFFNTHGTDQSIILGFYPLQNYQITQWHEFDERPLIFNNSCLSWTGVGRDFVRVGARGYVGTLWSVGVSAAADIARRSMARMINDAEPICGAIRQPEVDPFTSRAYIFVGTANASFSMDEQAAVADDPVRLVAVMQNYLHMLVAIRSKITAMDPDAFTAHLYAEFKALREALISLNESYLQPVVIDAMIAELDLLAEKDDALNAGLEYRAALADRCAAMLADAPLQERQRDMRVALLMQFRANINLLRGEFAQADADAQLSIDTYEKLGLNSQSPKQVRIQIAIDQNRLEQAQNLVAQTLAEIEQKNEPQLFDLASLGRLCQILKRDPARLDEGVKVAKQGIAAAIALKHLYEQATFELDLAQIYNAKNEPQNALEAAKRGLELARRANSAIGELAAYGTIGQAYTRLNDLQNARRYAGLGLGRARFLNEPKRAATFLADLARIEELDTHFAEAVGYWSASMETAAVLASLEMWEASASRAASLAVKVANPELGARYLCMAMTSLRLMRVDLTDSATKVLFSIVRGFYKAWPQATRLAMLRAVARTGELELAVTEREPVVSTHLGFLFATCEVFHLLDSGNGQAAGQLANHVDGMLGAQGQYFEAIRQVLS